MHLFDGLRAGQLQALLEIDETTGWIPRSFSQGRRFIEAGEGAAGAALPRLAAAFRWLRA